MSGGKKNAPLAWTRRLRLGGWGCSEPELSNSNPPHTRALVPRTPDPSQAALAAHDRYLRKFQYREALDAALSTKRAEVRV